MIFIENRRKSLAKLQEKYPQSKIIDVTSRAEIPFVKLSPFYPVGDIPVPFSDGQVGQSVEGIWQGLKVFENQGIDTSFFENKRMKGLKRTVRKYGPVKGHQAGVNSETLLNYVQARKQIYLPIYLWVLEHKVTEVLALLQEYRQSLDLVLLDYETNGDINDTSKPLSHAYLIKYYLEGNYPK